MESKSDVRYVSYNVQQHYRTMPEGPVTCPICSGDLIKSPVKPSKTMNQYIEGPEYDDDGSSLLFVCSQCRWWCIREHYEFFSFRNSMRYGYDHLIVSMAKINKSDNLESLHIEDAQPWLQALEDLKVYDDMQTFPEELAAVFRDGETWKEYPN